MGENTASLILPVHSDPDFAGKREVITRVSAKTGWRLILPDYDHIEPVFDVVHARANLATAALVVADLSRARPSCYFELGFAEALGKEVHCMAEAGTEIHQTSQRGSVRFYQGLPGFEAALTEILTREGQ